MSICNAIFVESLRTELSAFEFLGPKGGLHVNEEGVDGITGAMIADGVDECRKAVRKQIGAGADWIKVSAENLVQRRTELFSEMPFFNLGIRRFVCVDCCSRERVRAEYVYRLFDRLQIPIANVRCSAKGRQRVSPHV